jgi:hypothetical protein
MGDKLKSETGEELDFDFRKLRPKLRRLHRLTNPRIFLRTCLSPTKNAELDFRTTQPGHLYSTSVGGTLTGRGGNIVIIDDPLKPIEASSEAQRDFREVS